MSQEKSYHELRFICRMNVTYHESREAFYSFWQNFVVFISLIFSSAAFATIGDWLPFLSSGSGIASKELWTGLFAFLVAIANGASLAYGFPSKATTHHSLKQKWLHLLGQVEAEEDVKQLNGALHLLCAEEPAAKDKKLKEAYRRTCEAMGLEPDAKAA